MSAEQIQIEPGMRFVDLETFHEVNIQCLARECTSGRGAVVNVIYYQTSDRDMMLSMELSEFIVRYHVIR